MFKQLTVLAALIAILAATVSATASAATPTASRRAPGPIVFAAQLWSKTITDPLGAWRLYYFNKCSPVRGVREFRMEQAWIVRTYSCWALLHNG